jgi:hypothetical protein
MQETITPEMVRSVYSRAQEPRALLLTLTAEGIDDLFFTDWSEGVESNGTVFEYFPFNFKWHGSSTTEQARGAQLEIFNRDRRITEAIRTAEGKPFISVSLVRLATPDIVEIALDRALLDNVEIDGATVTGMLMPKTFKTEPGCSARYTYSRTPGLF